MGTARTLTRIRDAITSVEAAAITGIVAAIQLSLSTFLLQAQPSADASTAELTSWYAQSGNRDEVVWALQLAPVGAISFVWFMAVVRNRLGQREDQFFA